MSQQGKWATQVDIQAATDLYGIPLYTYVTVHAKKWYKSANLILRYSCIRLHWRVQCESRFFAHKINKAF